jgi:hypothetical protein
MPARAAAQHFSERIGATDISGEREDLVTACAKSGHHLGQVFVDALRQT